VIAFSGVCWLSLNFTDRTRTRSGQAASGHAHRMGNGPFNRCATRPLLQCSLKGGGPRHEVDRRVMRAALADRRSGP
jgi:hypothetical protein